MMVEKEYPSGKLTEVELGKRLRALRLADPSCVDESFAPIIGWNEHGAIVHYEATEESDVEEAPATERLSVLPFTSGRFTSEAPLACTFKFFD